MTKFVSNWPVRRYWWAYALIGAAILVSLLLLIPFEDDDTEVSLSRFVAFARAGEVTAVRVDDNDRDFKFKVSTSDETYESAKERELPLRQLLLDAGLTGEEVNGIDIAVESSDSSSVVSLIINIFPILVIVGIVLFFLRVAMNPQKLRAQMFGLVTNADPVCGMTVNPGSSAGTSTFQGITYHFCSAQHKEQFDGEPVKYLLQK